MCNLRTNLSLRYTWLRLYNPYLYYPRFYYTTTYLFKVLTVFPASPMLAQSYFPIGLHLLRICRHRNPHGYFLIGYSGLRASLSAFTQYWDAKALMLRRIVYIYYIHTPFWELPCVGKYRLYFVIRRLLPTRFVIHSTTSSFRQKRLVFNVGMPLCTLSYFYYQPGASSHFGFLHVLSI